ncbi:Eukaryotic translation initiation factor 3 subunit H [Bagarius yarrelli]|uniref:Eukaryotic translation initiation factor 3 subunit H n=1 Tax=Bagarius yarrelli TaxID=175774 RepID=A0A556TPD1_BAGYA|nr:Eukaryotic translation initiation factor 3 subunit H [Bagarius yarrelli]
MASTRDTCPGTSLESSVKQVQIDGLGKQQQQLPYVSRAAESAAVLGFLNKTPKDGRFFPVDLITSVAPRNSFLQQMFRTCAHFGRMRVRVGEETSASTIEMHEAPNDNLQRYESVAASSCAVVKEPGRPSAELQVVLKIIKHYQEEGQGSEVVQGVLLGLVVDDRLEITNCFPFPQHTEDDADFDEVQYQMEMMRSLRHVNIDHLHVGWYQSTFFGSFMSRALLDSQFSYQHAIEESVVLIYDPIKTAQGSLSLKAYRLTPKLMEICKEKDFSSESLKKASVGYEDMFEEVPIVIKNSHLVNVLLWELESKTTVLEKHELLSLSSRLERVRTHTHTHTHSCSSCIKYKPKKSLQMLMDRVDDMCQDISKYNNYSRSLSKQQQQKHQYTQRRQQENAQRQSRGEPPLPEEDLTKLFKPPQPPPRMDSLLVAGQINTYCQTVKEFTSQNLGKLFMAEALQADGS